MKILILGADGMIGHKIAQILINTDNTIILNSRNNNVFLRKNFPRAEFYSYDFLKQDTFELLNKVNPNIIINCIGLTIRRGADIIKNALKLNNELPHTIDTWCAINSKRLIHFSTDCVFSGSRGNYLDLDFPDAKDNYGRTKGKGEILSSSTLTIRSSMIGRELFNKTELLEWLISQKGQNIKGFSKVIYSGVTTIYMAKLIEKEIFTGVYNISSPPISKYELLIRLNKKFQLGIKIKKVDSKKSNKSLVSSKFFSKFSYQKPNWDNMVEELFQDSVKFHELYQK
jgi:dTDP-4-dehydrorhamnose reductase